MKDTRTNLMDAAEKRMRTGGYHSVSFRELADDLGIKSASVHYHFKQKEDLGVAVVERYAHQFFSAVNVLLDQGVPELEAYARAYRAAYDQGKQGCLCGMLGAESRGLPERVAAAVKTFMDDNMAWLLTVMPDDIPDDARRQAAVQVLASLQGGMMLAVSTGDASMLDAIVDGLRSE